MVVIPYKFKDKDALRKWLWKYLSDYHLTMQPRPCYARIPSFKAVELAVRRLVAEPAWKDADTVVISADEVTFHARWEAIKDGKRLIVPIPRGDRAHLVEGIAPANAQVAAMMKEIGKFSSDIPLTRAGDAPLLITGALSVDRFGNWLGQGEVFGELAPEITQKGGLLDTATRIALVDDFQIFEDFTYLTSPDDLPVHRIVTKTQVVLPKPPEDPPLETPDAPITLR
ncbi:MAG: 5-formyltetrahydrofolate cyclo-ligase [Leptospirillia bacterium]